MNTIRLSVTEGRADLVLDRPDVLNAMSFEMFDDLAAACDEIASSAQVQVVVVSGAGRSFCSGIDLNELGAAAGAPDEVVARAQAGFRKLAALEMPTIARVHGHAYGAGLQVALMCDLRVVARDASLGLLEMRYGIIPDLGGSTRLPQLVGTGRAKKMIWLAERIDGAEAERIGLAELCAGADELDAVVDDLAQRLAGAPQAAVRAAKRLIDGAPFVAQQEGMDREAVEQARLLTHLLSRGG